MPPQDRFGLYDHQGGARLAPSLGEEDPKSRSSFGAEDARPFGLTRPVVDGARDSRGDGPVPAADESDRSEEYEQGRQHP
jgi:hypothetical protein